MTEQAEKILPEKKMQATRYVVLREVIQGPTTETKRKYWEDVGRGEARSAKAAVRAYVEARNMSSSEAADPGVYVAVPERSWDPLVVQTETKTRLVFG
jgi:membrane-bound ClpP family serine protease